MEKAMKVLILATDGEKGWRKLCAIPLAKRMLYTLRSVGLRDVIIVTEKEGNRLREEIGDGSELGMRVLYSVPKQLPEALEGPFLALEANYVLDERIIRRLSDADGMVVAYDSRSEGGIQVVVEDGMARDLSYSGGDGAYVGASRCEPDVLTLFKGMDWTNCLAKALRSHHFSALDVATIERYVAEIRRELPVLWCRIESDEDGKRCKRMLVEGAQKRTLDILAWYFNRPIENWLTLRLADTPLTPNQMSVLTYLVAMVVVGLLLAGKLKLAALLCFVVNVMDGLDGKLARVKGLITKLGHMEHSFDLLYEQSWYIALAWATYRLRGDVLPLVIGFAALLFDSFARHVSMQFRQVMGVSLADYAPFDRRFRRFDGRRNIYSIYILLGAIFGVPLCSLIAIAIHAFITGVVYAIRAAKHLRNADLGRFTQREDVPVSVDYNFEVTSRRARVFKSKLLR
jgi:CDP-L-myo-inositol myo-inositolphosphotransferase